MSKSKSILLVGSVPLADPEAVFRILASKLGMHAKRYPEGRRVSARTGSAGSAMYSSGIRTSNWRILIR